MCDNCKRNRYYTSVWTVAFFDEKKRSTVRRELEKGMYFNAIVVYITFRIIIDGRICIQIKLKPDIVLDILQINKYNRGGDNCNGNIAVGQ